MTPLTDREREVLEHVAQHIERWGFQPSYREIADHFGWASAGYVTVLVSSMEIKGWVARWGSRAIHFNWIGFRLNNKEVTHDTQATDGSRTCPVPRRDIRRGQQRGSDRVHGSVRSPRRRLAERKPARAGR